MVQFEMIEIVTATVALVFFVPSLLIYPGAIIYRNSYALLRDVKPLYVILNHVASLLFATHLMLAWKHEGQLRVLLEVFQLLGNIFFFGFFVCKHYVLCRRYETDGATPLPPYVVFTLASGPFVLVSTYRLADNFSSSCYSDLATGVVGLLELLLVRTKYLVGYHPSPHFLNASRLESVTIFVAAAICIVHQWVDADPAMVTMILLLAFLVNASFIAYIMPPLWSKFRRRDEYTVQSRFGLGDKGHNQPRYGGASSGLTSPLNVEAGGIGIAQEKNAANVVVDCESENWFSRLMCKLITPLKAKSTSNNSLNTADTPHQSGAGSSGSWMDTLPYRVGGQGNSLAGDEVANRATSPDLRQLIEIIQDGDGRRLQTFLARTRLTVLNEGDGRGRTPLHHAVTRGDINIIRFLLQMGSDRNQADHHGYAPLHDAVRQSPGQRPKSNFYDVSNVICELLDGTGGGVGALINQATPGGFTALHFTIMRDQLGALHTLLRYDANPMYNNDREDEKQPWQEAHTGSSLTFDTCRRAPLTLAVELGLEKHVSSMLQTLKSHRTREVRCPHGLTLLHIALSLGHSKVVDVLLREAKSNPMATHEPSKMNCFHLAALGGSCEALCQIVDALDFPDVLPTQLRKDASSGSGTFGERFRDARSPVLSNTPKSFRRDSSRSMSVGLFPKSASFEPSAGSQREPRLLTGSGGFPGANSSASCAPVGMLSGQRQMTTGEALGLLQRYIPGFIMDSERLNTMEGRVDAAVAEVRSHGGLEEASRLQHAMLVLTRRCKAHGNGSRSGASSRENLFFSSSNPATFTPDVGSLSQSHARRPIDLLTATDNQGMTPLHYAIRQGDLRMVTIISAVVSSSGDELEGSAGSSSNFVLDSQHKSNSTTVTSPLTHGSGAFSESSINLGRNSSNALTMDQSSGAYFNFARDEHGNIEAQEIMEAVDTGKEIARAYLAAAQNTKSPNSRGPSSMLRGSGPGTPVPTGVETLEDGSSLTHPPLPMCTFNNSTSSQPSLLGNSLTTKMKSNSPNSQRELGPPTHMRKSSCVRIDNAGRTPPSKGMQPGPRNGGATRAFGAASSSSGPSCGGDPRHGLPPRSGEVARPEPVAPKAAALVVSDMFAGFDDFATVAPQPKEREEDAAPPPPKRSTTLEMISTEEVFTEVSSSVSVNDGTSGEAPSDAVSVIVSNETSRSPSGIHAPEILTSPSGDYPPDPRAATSEGEA